MCIVCNPGLFHFLREGATTRRGLFKSGAALGAAALLPNVARAQSSGAVDTVFVRGRVHTMDASRPAAEAVAVRAGRIVAVGSTEQIKALQGANTTVVDLAGRTLLPGFVDPHIHYTFAFIDDWLDLGPFVNANMDAVRTKVTQAVAAAKPGEWVMGQLLDPTITPGRWDVSVGALDALSPTIPIFMLEANGHIAHVNSAAFKAAGITASTPDPAHGRFVRDAQGRLTGAAQESAAISMFAKAAPHIDGAQYLANVKKLFKKVSAKGCTSLHDNGIGSIDPEGDVAVLRAAMAADSPIRMSAYLISTHMDKWEKMGFNQPDNRNDLLRINGIKAWIDGTNQGGSGFQTEPYLVKEWGKGFPNYTQDEINAVVKRAHDANWQVGIHANGDAGIDMALKAFENAQRLNPKADLRHRIEHSTICPKGHLARMKRAGVSPSFLIGHVYYYGAVFRDQIFGAERAQMLDPCRSALDAGLRISVHSDYNCQPIDPLRCVHNAVTRTIRGTKQKLNPAEAISVDQALRAVTIDAAWQCHMDDIVGSIETGKCADFVVLEQDPTRIDPERIIDIPVLETWMDGVRRYAA